MRHTIQRSKSSHSEAFDYSVDYSVEKKKGGTEKNAGSRSVFPHQIFRKKYLVSDLEKVDDLEYA